MCLPISCFGFANSFLTRIKIKSFYYLFEWNFISIYIHASYNFSLSPSHPQIAKNHTFLNRQHCERTKCPTLPNKVVVLKICKLAKTKCNVGIWMFWELVGWRWSWDIYTRYSMYFRFWYLALIGFLGSLWGKWIWDVNSTGHSVEYAVNSWSFIPLLLTYTTGSETHLYWRRNLDSPSTNYSGIT